jgi:hypothetical protein
MLYRGDAMSDGAPDPYRDILGLDLPLERLAEVVRLYRRILAEIAELRALDLTDVHPAVMFDPASGWEEEAP